MVTTGPVTSLTADPIFRPGAEQTGQVSLIAFGDVAGGVTAPTIIGFFAFTRVIGTPALIRAQGAIGQIELGGGVGSASN